MSPPTTDRLLDLLAQWEAARHPGPEPTPDQLCPEDPALAARLRAAIDQIRRLEPKADSADQTLDTDTPDLPGYQLAGELGRGSFGVVYRGRQLGLNREVAVKVLAGGGTTTTARFLAEAEAVAAAEHPNVVRVYDTGKAAGRPFLVLEFCDGGTLADKLKAGRLKAAEAASLLEAVADGVAAAHARQIVHRDLKPGNVLFAGGVPKVADFGLAKSATGPDLTASHAVMGTPAYMAPEQAGGGAKFVGPPADVWALGVMLYEALAGRRPFVAADTLGVLEKVRAAEPASLRSVERSVPRELELVVAKCLAKEPADRYPTAAELAADLGRWRRGEPVSARPVVATVRAWKWVKRNPGYAGLWAGLAAALVLGTTASLVFAWRSARSVEAAGRSAEQAGLAAASATTQAARADAEAARAGAEARAARRSIERVYTGEGLRLAEAGNLTAALAWLAGALEEVAGDPEREDVCRRRIAAYARQTPRPVTPSPASRPTSRPKIIAGDWPMRFDPTELGTAGKVSPNRRLVANGVGGTSLRVWDEAAGQPAVPDLTTDGQIRVITFSPDGRRLAAGCMSGSVLIVSPDERPPARTVTLAEDTMAVLFSPDGRQIAALGLEGAVRVWEAASGRPVAVLAVPPQFGYPALQYSPNGRHLSVGTVAAWNLSGDRPMALPLTHTGGQAAARFSDDGRFVVTAKSTAQVWDGTTGRAVPAGDAATAPRTLTAFAADGRLVGAVWRFGPLPPAGETVAELTALPRDVMRVVSFSPSGRRLLYTRANDTAVIWDVTAERLAGPPVPVYWPTNAAFAPDETVVATATRDSVRVWEVATGRHVTPLLSAREVGDPLPEWVSGVAVSPCRRWVAAATSRGGRVWAVAAPGDRSLLPHAGANRTAFSPDGRLLATAGDGTARLWDVATGQPVTPPLGHAGEVADITFSPDGRLLATAAGDGTARLWDVTTGQPVTPPLGHAAPLTQATFSPDGGCLLTTDQARIARLWDVSADASPVATLVRRCELRAGGRIDPVAGFVRLGPAELAARRADPGDWDEGGVGDEGWHRHRLADAQAVRDPFATQFHARALLRGPAPADEELVRIDAEAGRRRPRELAPAPRPAQSSAGT